jgi:methyl-accepting chemotaxis protein
MQAKLGAGFVTVALLYVLLGLLVPRLGLRPPADTILLVSSYIVVGLGAAWTISFVLSRRLRALARAAALISRGDLTRRLETSGRDETAELARSLSVMTESLLNVVLEVQTTADRINSSAQSLSTASGRINANTEEIADTAREIARGAEEQANQVLRTTETTRELSQAVDRVAAGAGAMQHAASEATDRASRGARDARQAAEAIDVLIERTESATAAVDGFRLKASEIGNIVSFITSIAHQTHLLSINAAIEAVRAGEEGRGFGVLAEEVSRLADNVRRFAEQISTISEEIMQGASDVADEIRRSLGATEQVGRVVQRAAASFDGILKATHGTAAHVGEISELSGKQKIAAEEVTRSLEEISRIAERNALGTDEASSSTREQTLSMQRMVESANDLAGTSDQLKDLISIFKLH